MEHWLEMVEAVVQRCSVKKTFLEISQNSQENTCARVSFLIATLLKKRLWHRCFTVNFAKFLRASFLKEHLWWLLLKWGKSKLRAKVQHKIKPTIFTLIALEV